MNARHLSLAVVAVLLAWPPLALGQTIRPLVSEYRAKASGRVELVNNGDRPMTVVLELKGFRVDERGDVHDEPLPDALSIKLSSSSVRIPARQTRFVFYEATSTATPSWFVILARFAGYSRREFSGLDVQLELPHYVYVLPARTWKADDLHVVSASLDRERHLLQVVVENAGGDFGRVSEIEVRGGDEKGQGVGFPLFPGGRRQVDVPWPANDPPETITIRAQGLNVQRRLPF